MSTDTRPSVQCSFCGKSQDDVARLLMGPDDTAPFFICDECVRLCAAILDEGDDMAVDARPSVTVIGSLVEYHAAGDWGIDIDDLPDGHPFADGDELEVTIRRHERATGSLFPASDEADE